MDERFNIKDIQREYKEDIKWENKSLQSYIITLPAKISKYHTYWYYYKKMVDLVQKEYDDTYIDRYTYFKNGESDLTLSASETKSFVEKDLDLNKINLKLKTNIANCELIEKMIKNLDSIRWDIKSYMEYEKFINGVY